MANTQPAPSNTVVQNPTPGASSIDYGNAAQAQIVSANLANAASTKIDYTGSGLNPSINSGYSPIANANQPTASGFNSSAQVGVNQNSVVGMTNATNGIINGGQPQQQPPQPQFQQPQQGGQDSGANNTVGFMAGQAAGAYQTGVGAYTQAYNLQLQNAQLANQSIGLQYNTALAGLNQQYNQQFQTLQTQHMNTIGAAVQQMSQADPMGTQSSSFASGYIGKVNDMYSQQASFLNAAYNQQQVALQNGQAQAAIGIQQQINAAQSQFSQGIAQLNQGLASSMTSIAQFAQGQSNFQQSRSLQSQTNFESALKGTNLTGVDPNASLADLQSNYPNLFTEGQQAGFSDEQVAQSIKTGTLATKNTQIAQQNLYNQLYRTQAQFGANPNGGNPNGTNPTGSTLSPFGQSLLSAGGTASVAPHTDVVNAIGGMASAASPGNLKSLTDFVNSGNTSALTTVVGGMLNGFLGTNIGNITSAKDVGTAVSENLGISADFAGLANQSPQTRAKVVQSILQSLQGKLQEKSKTYGSEYNISNLAPQLDAANSKLTDAIQSLSSMSGTPASASAGGSPGSLTSLYSGLNNMNWGSAFSGLGDMFGSSSK